MDIKELAKNIIVALNIVSKENVMIDVITSDWNGEKPEIRITSEPSKPEDETQFGAISETTVMGIHVLADVKQRQEVIALKKRAADAVLAKFEELEQQRGSGILCIIPVEHNSFQIPNTEVFQAFTNFQILHFPTL